MEFVEAHELMVFQKGPGWTPDLTQLGHTEASQALGSTHVGSQLEFDGLDQFLRHLMANPALHANVCEIKAHRNPMNLHGLGSCRSPDR